MCADTGPMAADGLPDLEVLATELVQLEQRRGDLLRQHDKLTARLLAFPNDLARRQASALAEQIGSLTHRMQEIEAQLVPRRAAR